MLRSWPVNFFMRAALPPNGGVRQWIAASRALVPAPAIADMHPGIMMEEATMATTIQDIPLKTIDGADKTLADYAGEVLLIVNVASKCGLTAQYEGLEKLYEKYRDQGFAVLGFPANDFGAQEPGSDDEIASFCTTNFGVKFPMFSKISVVGEDKHPLYAALTSARPKAEGDPEAFRERLRGYGMTPNPEPEVLWNFEKFVVSRDGEVVARFAPTAAPDDDGLVSAIERELVPSE
jgi:glutathione peroxidase